CEQRADQVAYAGIALDPEGRQLFPSLSVEENLRLGSTVGRPGPWSLDAVYDLFPILRERRNQASTSLSGGQQQMVAIGRALMSNPELILFDEISLGLAPVIIKSIYDALPSIISGGMTALIVEQDITKALAVSSRVYCLQEGRVSLTGRVEDITRDQITAAYFGVDA
ncbi:MAG: ATP-binding cassette domain-containing protein, partial [Pseudomonadota bacterium]